MPKTIPIALETAKSQSVILTSRLLRIGPLRDGVTYLRMTNINRNETYDTGSDPDRLGDGLGPQTWYAGTGMQMTTIEATNDLSVDNAEVQSLAAVYPMPGLTEDMVNRGELDTVEYVVFEHDCVNGAAGEHEIVANGVLGDCRIEQGLVVIPELRSWSQLLDQTGIISQTSIDCRVKRFGSQPGDEREWCGFNLAYEWVPFTVTAVGTETVREFYADTLAEIDDYFAPGLVLWSTGDNAGQSQEIESYLAPVSSDDAYVSLRFTTREPIQVGDQGEARRDCTRKWSGHNSCQTYFTTLRGAHFRGEPLINIGDTTANSVPGVNATTNTGGTGE